MVSGTGARLIWHALSGATAGEAKSKFWPKEQDGGGPGRREARRGGERELTQAKERTSIVTSVGSKLSTSRNQFAHHGSHEEEGRVRRGKELCYEESGCVI